MHRRLHHMDKERAHSLPLGRIFFSSSWPSESDSQSISSLVLSCCCSFVVRLSLSSFYDAALIPCPSSPALLSSLCYLSFAGQNLCSNLSRQSVFSPGFPDPSYWHTEGQHSSPLSLYLQMLAAKVALCSLLLVCPAALYACHPCVRTVLLLFFRLTSHLSCSFPPPNLRSVSTNNMQTSPQPYKLDSCEASLQSFPENMAKELQTLLHKHEGREEG